MVQCEQQFPVVECRHTLVDAVERDELSIGLEVRQYLDDRLGEVLIEGEAARHVRALSCCDGGSQVMSELSLEVEGVLDRGRLHVRV